MRCWIGVLVLTALSASTASAGDLTVSSAPDSNITFVNGGYEPVGAGPGNLNTMTLASGLAGAAMTVRASGDVIFQDAFTWSSTNRLTVEAGANVVLLQSITNVVGAPVRLRADSGGTGVGTIQAGAFHVTAASVDAFHNPGVFPTPELLWTGGTTPTAYMLVNSLPNLQMMAANLAGNYALGRDIDASGPAFTPVGNTATPFTGRFDGNAQTIRNLDVSLLGDSAGLFGSTSNALVRNVRIVDATVVAANQAGILIGSASNTTVDRVFTSGSVTATNNNAGGIAGLFSGSLAQSASTATVGATVNAGGLIGQLAAAAMISDAYATGSVVATNVATGGLVGTATSATITNAYSAGPVAAVSDAGGLAGVSAATTYSNCFWDQQASGQLVSAGGTAKTTAQMRQQATFTGWNFAGVWSIIEGKTYPYFALFAPIPATGDLVISSDPTANVTLSNGVFQATASPAVLNVTDLTTALAASNVIVRALASGSGDLAILAPVSWGSASRLRIEARGDVILAANITGAGTLHLRSELGTIVGPATTSSAFTQVFYNPPSFPTPTDLSGFGADAAFMLIHTRTQLESVSLNKTGVYALASDLDLGGTPLLPLSTNALPFRGTFTGDLHTVRGLVIDQPAVDGVGLFGATHGAEIRDLRIENAAVAGRSQVGILIGHVQDGADTWVDRVIVSGSVTASGSAAGGLAGQSDASGFSQTASSASVTSTGAGQQHFGGAFGLANPSGFYPVTFTDSYATGAVNGGTSSSAGGFGGTTNAATGVFNTHAAGAVTGAAMTGGLLGNGGGAEFQDYWDTQATGQASAGFGVTATGLTTPQMRMASSFSSWDFTNAWNIFESLTSPFLRIEDKALVFAPPSVVAGTQLTYTFAAAASTQTHENVVPVSFAHAVPAGTTLVSSALPAPANVVPGWSGTFDVTVSVSPSATGTLPVSGTFTTPTFTGVMNASVAVTTLADLSVAVSAAPDPVPAGGTLTYTATVTNAGPSDAANVVVSHVLPASLSLIGCTGGCVATSIAAGGSAVFTITASVPASLAAGTTLSATTSVASSTTDPDSTDNSTVTAVTSSLSADLSIVASVSLAEAGSPITWTVTVTNNGPSDASNVNVTHTLTGVTCSGSCTAATLAAGGSAVFTIDGTVPASTPEGTTLSGTFTVSSATTDANAANDSATPSAIVTTSADLAVTNVVATTANAGDPATWTVTVTNNGPSDAVNVTVSYPPLAQITGLTCSSSCAAASIASGASTAFTISGVIDPATIPGTVVSLTATAAAKTADPLNANDSAIANVAIATLSAITVAIADAPDPVAPNGSITYTIDVTNAGPSAATNVPFPITLAPGLSAALPPATIATLPVGTQTWVITATVNALPGATLTTSVSAGTSTASASTSVTSPSSITVTKSVQARILAVSAPVTYTITITNSGASTQFDNPGDEMTDALPPGLTLTSATATAGTVTTAGNEVRWNGALAPGASVTITIHATIAAPLPITNSATVRFDADGNGTNESVVASNAVTIDATAPVAIPTASTWVLLAMIAVLALAGCLRP